MSTQNFHYFVVIDFEASCDEEQLPYPQEIIEFPSVIVNAVTGELIDSFQTYVRPTFNHFLTDFCKDLIGIQQTQVDSGVTLFDALVAHGRWLYNKGLVNNFAVVTWTDWDCKVMLESECRLKNILKPHYFNRWINLKLPFYEVFGKERSNIRQAVEKEGLAWEGRAHCGLDDAKNTARLLSLIMERGFKFSITGSLPCKFGYDSCEAPKPAPREPLPYTSTNTTNPLCECGVRSSKWSKVGKPVVYFRCGIWTPDNGPQCQYFKWGTCTPDIRPRCHHLKWAIWTPGNDPRCQNIIWCCPLS